MLRMVFRFRSKNYKLRKNIQNTNITTSNKTFLINNHLWIWKTKKSKWLLEVGWGSGFRVQGFGFRVSGFGLRFRVNGLSYLENVFGYWF